jgi:NHLM bacteriocin system ABC transporter ATP-binding protein
MGWFDDQIENRKKYEDELLTEAFQNISQAVVQHKIGDGYFGEGKDIKDATSQLLRYFGVKEREVPSKLKSLDERLDYLLYSSGIFYREIHLEEGWHKDAMGVMMGSLKEDGAVITILPSEAGGFVYVDPHSGRTIKVNRKEEDKIDSDAYCFYRPFPMRKLKPLDLWKYMKSCLTTWDLVSFALAALVITLIGMLIPKLNSLLTGEVVTYGSNQLLAAVMIFMICVTIGNLVFSSIKGLLLTRISTKLSNNVTAATMMRVLSLPADFFKNYSTGELNQYLSYMTNICDTIVNAVFSTGITGVFSLVYLVQVFTFAKELVAPSIIVTLLTLAVSFVTASTQMVISKEQMKISAEEQGIVYSLISGIQKIRLSGAEKRAFAKWANVYAKDAELSYSPPAQVKLSKVITTAISLIGTIVIYYIAVRSNVTVANYYAFNSAYAYIQTAFTALVSVATTVATIRPGLELVKPLLDAEPESTEGLETVTDLSGTIDISRVSFKYSKDGATILDDISVHIPSGQYVAIVGKTGCGKSTLMRLLLGFEEPTSGSIFYDRKDTRSLDMHSVRKKIGTVMQNGKLFQGSVFENIIIADPTLSMDDAWKAAEMAGLSEDIHRMPMGMHTMISAGGGGISGGQRQRLMIARAVAPRPKILFLDEATSALDNITQKKVSESLDSLKCTRIVIAHRLSTIRHCDRILVLDKGKIVEDGTYEELIEKKGFFAELVERQRV